MNLHELAPAERSRHKRKRVGRGPGSGMGKTSTRGHKGLKARSGGSVRPGFEGGQMPLHRRLPKRGFKNIHRDVVAIVNVADLDQFEAGIVINESALRSAGLIKGAIDKIKILGDGEVTKSFSVKKCLVSKTARVKIEMAGGNIEQ
ncbi:MAG: 50S ribosomal protein L15 [Desulfamplus sp.]|nr:50S ribosomal protein L15 [Desulfamplus sp.]MBF0257817.1 50S ribosomal protein L15 [Desulfamplus sp.]